MRYDAYTGIRILAYYRYLFLLRFWKGSWWHLIFLLLFSGLFSFWKYCKNSVLSDHSGFILSRFQKITASKLFYLRGFSKTFWEGTCRIRHSGSYRNAAFDRYRATAPCGSYCFPAWQQCVRSIRRSRSADSYWVWRHCNTYDIRIRITVQYCGIHCSDFHPMDYYARTKDKKTHFLETLPFAILSGLLFVVPLVGITIFFGQKFAVHFGISDRISGNHYCHKLAFACRKISSSIITKGLTFVNPFLLLIHVRVPVLDTFIQKINCHLFSLTCRMRYPRTKCAFTALILVSSRYRDP